MLENSYDASGIKFGIIISSELPKYSDLLNSYDTDLVINTTKKVINDGEHSRFIDFSQIDGLKVKEVLELTSLVNAKNTIIFITYNSIKYTSVGSVHGQQFTDYINPRETILINKIESKEEKEITIDKKIEKYIIENYDNSDEDKKRWMRCFLQRYRYGTQEKTNEFIKQKIYRK